MPAQDDRYGSGAHGLELIEELIREQRRPRCHRNAIQGNRHAGGSTPAARRPTTAFDHLERQPDRLAPSDPESGPSDEPLEAAAGEETDMTSVENSPMVVVERPEQHAHARVPMTEVRDARHNGASRREPGRRVDQQPLRFAEMFEHIGREHDVVARTHFGRDAGSEIGLYKLAGMVARRSTPVTW